MYGKPSFIVLDEPNSNLDEQGEKALSVAMQTLKASGCTVVVISHKVNIISQVDKMLVMADGAVTLFGPRDEVLAKLKQAQQGQKPLPATTPKTPGLKPVIPV